MGGAPCFRLKQGGGPTFVTSIYIVILHESPPRFTYAVVAFNVVYSA